MVLAAGKTTLRRAACGRCCSNDSKVDGAESTRRASTTQGERLHGAGPAENGVVIRDHLENLFKNCKRLQLPSRLDRPWPPMQDADEDGLEVILRR